MINLDTIQLISLILGSTVVGSAITTLINNLFRRRREREQRRKVKNEADQVELNSEVKLTEFYREQLREVIKKYEALEQRLDEEAASHFNCREKIKSLEGKYTELQRQFTLLKTQIAAKTSDK